MKICIISNLKFQTKFVNLMLLLSRYLGLIGDRKALSVFNYTFFEAKGNTEMTYSMKHTGTNISLKINSFIH